MTSYAAWLLTSSLSEPPDGDDSPSFIRAIPGGLLNALHYALLGRQVQYLLTNETGWLGEIDTAVAAVTTELSIDPIGIYLPIGSKPGFQVPVADLANLYEWVENALGFTAPITAILDWILDVDIKNPVNGKGTNYGYFWDGSVMKQGVDFVPDRYMTGRDVYNFIILRRMIKLLFKYKTFGAAAAGSIAGSILRGWTSKTRTDAMKTTVDANLPGVATDTDSILAILGDPSPTTVTGKLDEVLDVPAETQLLITRLKLFLL